MSLKSGGYWALLISRLARWSEYILHNASCKYGVCSEQNEINLCLFLHWHAGGFPRNLLEWKKAFPIRQIMLIACLTKRIRIVWFSPKWVFQFYFVPTYIASPYIGKIITILSTTNYVHMQSMSWLSYKNSIFFLLF